MKTAFIAAAMASALLSLPAHAGKTADAIRERVRPKVEAIFRAAVEHHFTEVLGRPEILGRIKPGITVFDMLRPGVIDAITIRMLEDVCLARGPRLVVDPLAACATARHALASAKARSLGVREVRNVLTTRLRRVATWCALNRVGRDQVLRVELWPDRTVLDVQDGVSETLPA